MNEEQKLTKQTPHMKPITKHSSPEAGKKGEMSDKRWQKKRHIWNHRRTKQKRTAKEEPMETEAERRLGSLNKFNSRKIELPNRCSFNLQTYVPST